MPDQTPKPTLLDYYNELCAPYADRPNTLIAIRIGDFYEFYGKQAETVARALRITLTDRQFGEDAKRTPMAGVPFHSVEKYLARLLQMGYKVALAEQTEDTRYILQGTIPKCKVFEPRGFNPESMTIETEVRAKIAFDVPFDLYSRAMLGDADARAEILALHNDAASEGYRIAPASKFGIHMSGGYTELEPRPGFWRDGSPYPDYTTAKATPEGV